MSATHHPGWRDWADGVSEAIEYALADIDQSQASSGTEISFEYALDYALDRAYATTGESFDGRTYRFATLIFWSLEAASTLQMVLNYGPRDIVTDMDDRHAITSAISALLRHALISLDEYTSAMARHDKEHSR